MSETLFITTPCLNARATIDRTIQSVVTQAGDFFIRYHVQDGGSTDGTFERLQWWARRLNSKGFPLASRGLSFTVSSEPDSGMYDGLFRGIQALSARSDEFMTWINADDILMPGALGFIANAARQFQPQHVSWVGGANLVMRDGLPIVSTENPILKDALKAGLCDGYHWNFLQQEGTFFRKWLWDAINPETTIVPLKLAGDWNLWRLFATKASLVQTKFPLAAFCVTENQLSARLRDKYNAEIEAIIPAKERRKALAAMGKSKTGFTRRFFKVNYADGQLSVVDEGRNGIVQHYFQKVFDKSAALKPNTGEQKIVVQGDLVDAKTLTHDHISFENNILAYDKDWQFPAITEQQAFKMMKASGGVPDDVTYVAFPWANLIDKLQTKARDTNLHLEYFKKYCEHLPKGTTRVTVCQHIKMQEFMTLFEQAGISHIFWTHATHTDVADQGASGFTIHPFPLFPVQIPEPEARMEITKRPYLFSFIGAKANKYYLSQAREFILDLLRDHPKGLIIGRDDWHYNKVVYEHQIRPGGDKSNIGDLIDKPASEQFKISMGQSIFSLCPSGTGPNSIRLWETLGAGAIPVILADTYAPPGDPALWEAGTVICNEDADSIKALPARLEEIAADPERLQAMQKVGQQLFMLYGPQCFVYDVQKLMLCLGHEQDTTSTVKTPSHLLRETLAARMSQSAELCPNDAQMLLRVCSSDLLLEGAGLLPDLRDDSSSLGQLIELAQQKLPASHPTLQHFQSVSEHVVTRSRQPRLGSPRINGTSGPKICFTGRHGNRTPLSYPAFQGAAKDRIQIVTDPAAADFVMTGFNIDLKENADLFAGLAKSKPDTKVVVISEEPLWDSLWSGGFAETARKVTCNDTEVGYTFLNHANSSIFDFDRIPYFLLTEDDLLARYTLLIGRNCDRTPEDILKSWKAAPIPAAFVAEKRDDAKYDKSFPEQAVYGISSYRSQVAAKTTGKGVLREGKGWHDQKRRQDLPDWHLDKLAALDGRVRVMSSYENTHQKSYISEKILDAFVVGGVPTYYADKDHAITRLVPESSMINTFGMSASDAAKRISTFKPDLAMAQSWLETARALQERFRDTGAIRAERTRIVDAILSELEAL